MFLSPYRVSTLKRLLQNGLGCNSKTIMISTLNPASINYEETLSTVINESEDDKTVRLLKEENNELKKNWRTF